MVLICVEKNTYTCCGMLFNFEHVQFVIDMVCCNYLKMQSLEGAMYFVCALDKCTLTAIMM